MNSDDIGDRVKSGTLTPNEALPLVESALSSSSSSALWLLRGHLIQLSDASISYELDEVARSYLEAHLLAPESAEPLEELGHFYDAVMSDRVSAVAYYRAALEKGAGEDCSRALSGLLEQDW